MGWQFPPCHAQGTICKTVKKLKTDKIMIRILYLLVASALWSCSNKPAETASEQPSNQPVVTQASTNTPVFNADSAYQFVQRQVDFGPRVPNTSAHKQCGNYLASELKRFGAQAVSYTHLTLPTKLEV